MRICGAGKHEIACNEESYRVVRVEPGHSHRSGCRSFWLCAKHFKMIDEVLDAIPVAGPSADKLARLARRRARKAKNNADAYRRRTVAA